MNSKKNKYFSKLKRGGSLNWNETRGFVGITESERSEAQLLNFIFGITSTLPSMRIISPGMDDRNRTTLNNNFYTAILHNLTLDNLANPNNLYSARNIEQPQVSILGNGRESLIEYLNNTLNLYQKMELCNILENVVGTNQRRLSQSQGTGIDMTRNYNSLETLLMSLPPNTPITFDDIVRWNPLRLNGNRDDIAKQYSMALGLEGRSTKPDSIQGYHYNGNIKIPRDEYPANTAEWWQNELPNFRNALINMNKGHTSPTGYTSRLLDATIKLYRGLGCGNLNEAYIQSPISNSRSYPSNRTDGAVRSEERRPTRMSMSTPYRRRRYSSTGGKKTKKTNHKRK